LNADAHDAEGTAVGIIVARVEPVTVHIIRVAEVAPVAAAGAGKVRY